MSDQPTSPRAGNGAVLPKRSASVILHERESTRAGRADKSGDTLQSTKDFVSQPADCSRRPKLTVFTQYNLRASSPAAGPSSRLSVIRNARARTASRASSVSRTTSPPASDSNEPSASARHSIPLPTPRAFLTPKKSAAAVRLEQKERAAALRRSQLPSDGQNSNHEPSGTVSQANIARSPEPQSINAALNTLQEDHDRPLSSVNDHLHQSITDMSSPLQRNLPDLDSSSNLFRSQSSSIPEKKAVRRRSFQRKSGTEAETAKRKRWKKYEKLDNPLTTFFCGGRMVTGGDSWWSMLFTLLLLLAMTGIWVGTTGWWLWKNGSQYGLARGAGVGIMVVFIYLFGLTMSSLVVSALRDPGIIPRNLDTDPPLSQVESWWEPMSRDVMVAGNRVPVKYCETCQIYRPPRCSHCRLCGNCVDGIDHHCSYLHSCVGKRNYLSFLVLLVTAGIANIYIVIFSAVHFSLLCHHDHIQFGRAIQDSPGAAVSFLLGIFILPGIFFLLHYHIRLLLYNLTTVEQIRASASTNLFRASIRPENPFADHSLLHNALVASVGRPQFPSWVDASAWNYEDRREINPALTDPKWAKEIV